MAMDERKIVDGILIVDDNDPRRCVIFNFRTWVEIIKGLMVQCAGKRSRLDSSELAFGGECVAQLYGSWFACP
jgi:hypothetical protein